MIPEEVTGSTQTLQWKCVESRVESKRLYYGRFILSPLRKGQADTVGSALRRVLLAEIEGTCITRAKFGNVPHEYSTIVGIEESIQEILLNLKDIVLRSNLYGVRDASICVKGPRYITAQDIILPPSVEIVDTTQPIANLRDPMDFCIELQIKRDRGYHPQRIKNSKDGSYPIDAVFMPVRNVNYNVFSRGIGNEEHEILFLEIWTNGSLTPKEALYEASRNLIDLFLPFLHAEEEGANFEAFAEKADANFEAFLHAEEERAANFEAFAEKEKEDADLEAISFPHAEEERANFEENKTRPSLLTIQKRFNNLKKNKRGMARLDGVPLNRIFIDQLELPSIMYYRLKGADIHTLFDLLSKTEEELLTIDSLDMGYGFNFLLFLEDWGPKKSFEN
jgi:DNA-directed RNA polymerase subunit alpha|uniref:DNA-directed RNA polymerase n=1 Tax=Distichlis spicata TaxID=38594 RepID=A0A141NYK8_9POAL|nr:RNA polymerase alpha subunit [Distichlis spicata]AMB36034.1 RNA polymerase alpha subunit [Distichlis spicata]